MAKQLIPKGGNDKFYTPPDLAAAIIKYFHPTGSFLEPCRGEGAFLDAFLNYDKKISSRVTDFEYFEIDEGKDFLSPDTNIKNYGSFDWIITNYPYSLYRKFLIKSMEMANNIVSLSPINHILGSKARMRDVKEAGFFIREILQVEKPAEWLSSGFAYAAIYLNKKPGLCKISELIY